MRRKLRSPISVAGKEDLQFLKELVKAGKVTPAIGKAYPLAGIHEAIRLLEEEHALGKAVITMCSADRRPHGRPALLSHPRDRRRN
jgi:D-arabinose 1-dehydrogenase-like Zn-dependent alcohol dehydrogenase